MGNSSEIIIILVITFLVLGVLVIVSFIKNADDKQSRLNKINEAINNEINNFLLEKNDINYTFKSKELELKMRSELKTAIIDLRCNRTEFNRAYINRSETKIKQIYKIINKYYILDKNIIIEVNDEEINNDN